MGWLFRSSETDLSRPPVPIVSISWSPKPQEHQTEGEGEEVPRASVILPCGCVILIEALFGGLYNGI